MSKIAKIASLAAALTVCAFAAQANAAPAGQTQPRLEVSYADLNLDTQHGRGVLVARIKNAARAVCGNEADPRNIPASLRFSKCMRDSAQRAAASVTIPQVRTALESMLTNGSGS